MTADAANGNAGAAVEPAQLTSTTSTGSTTSTSFSDDTEYDEDEFIFTDHLHVEQEKVMIGQMVEQIKRRPSLAKLLLPSDMQTTPEEAEATSSNSTTMLPRTTTTTTTKKQKKSRTPSIVAARSQGFEMGRDETLEAVLQEIETMERRQALRGMREWKFTWGLLHTLLIIYVFGAHPGHFWMLYVCETLYWVSLRFHAACQMKPLSEALYFVDFCWAMNFMGVILAMIFMVVSIMDMTERIDLETRRQLFMGLFGIFAGPVFMAAAVLPFVAFLFHDTATMATLIIHLLPSMQMYIMRWKANTIQEACPYNMFDLSYIVQLESELSSDMIPFATVARNALWIYFAWFVPFVTWMLVSGMGLPRVPKHNTTTTTTPPPPKYDTVFHSIWRGTMCELIGKKLWKNRTLEQADDMSKRNDFETRDFGVYMMGHALACIVVGIQIFARICFVSQRVHFCMLSLVVIVCVRRGAQRYTYYTTVMYGSHLRKHFQKEKQKLQQQQERRASQQEQQQQQKETESSSLKEE